MCYNVLIGGELWLTEQRQKETKEYGNTGKEDIGRSP